MSFGAVMGHLAALAGYNTASEPDPILSDTAGNLNHGRWAWFSSSVFGQSHGHWFWDLEDMLHVRRVLFWIAAVVIILLIAAITNPTETSFRSYLTELSFRRHLADIRQSDPEATDDETAVSSSPSNDTVVHSHSGTETPPIAPFRFANHVAISLRTPPLHYKTLFFLSFALTSPLSPPSYLTDPTPLNKKHSTPPARERNVLFIGYLGHWVLVGQMPQKVDWVWRLFNDSTREKGRKKNALFDRPGITELRSIASKEDSSAVKAIAGIPTSTPSKHSRKTDSIGNLGDNLSTLPLHAHPAPIPVAPFVPESRRASIVNLVAQPSLPAEEAAVSPLLIGLKTDLAAAQAALAEVKAQLTSHEESVSSGSLHLQNSLDEVRNRRKEDDAERQELKSRTKALDEQKRQAEGARREAEKKLKAIEAVRDGLEGKIAAALAEIEDLRGLMGSSVKNLRIIQEQGARFVIETREMSETKREELDEAENDIGELDARNEELLRAIKEAEETVEAALKAGEEARKIGPEEEMMMMAAAYEAAAQEGYNAQTHGPGQAGYRGSAGGDQWAHQAAQYMAEAGMPFIDQKKYTARPSQSTSFGAFAKPPKHEERGQTDLLGFEDFGPGKGHVHGSSTPPASDSGSDVWGHDPGSPNGGISSSFSQNLLPQELFRSLEGDITPMVTDTDEESVAEVSQGFNDPFLGHTFENGDDGSGSESSGVEADNEADHAKQGHHLWRSALHNSNSMYPGQSASERQLLPPSHTPPGQPTGSAPVLPGLPVPMAGSRRWFSGTSSTEHVNLFGSSPSNDSSAMGAYEPSPFALTSSEKQQLAKWGTTWSKKWGGGRDPTSPRRRDPRSELGNGTVGNNHGNTVGGGGWLSNLRKDGGVDITSPKKEDDTKSQLGSSGSADKKPFRFFSLRRPTSSGGTGDRSGTSPAREQ